MFLWREKLKIRTLLIIYGSLKHGLSRSPKGVIIMKVALISLMTLIMTYILFWPSSIEPLAWVSPQNPGFSGNFSSNERLSELKRINLPNGQGPEDVAIDDEQWVYGGLKDGRIIKTKGGVFKEFANTGGRPLGLHFHQGKLLVADSYRGLLRISSDGQIETLSHEAEGIPFALTDDVDVGPDGSIYFTDASYKFSVEDYQSDSLEHRPNGRLLLYHPKTKTTNVLVRDLYFANGVAVAKDGSFVLVNETWKYRIMRYWIKGSKKGQLEVFKDQLPGFPDGISRGEEGIFWLTLISPRNRLLDFLAPYPYLRKVIDRLPSFMKPDAARYGCVIGLDKNGKITQNLQDSKAEKFAYISSVQQYRQRLWLGSLKEKAIAYIDLKNPSVVGDHAK